MKKILFLTTYASPYRVRFFDALGEHCEVTVLFSDRADAQKHRDAEWFVSGNGRAKFVQLSRRVGSLGKKALCVDVLDWLRKPFDAIVICGYSSPTFMLAIAYLRMKKIPFFMEVDGGMVRPDPKPLRWYKRQLVGSASGWFSTGKATDDYLIYYGAKPEKIWHYPFTTLREADLLKTVPSQEEKSALRQKLGITEQRMILTVGQMDHRKGFDVLLRSVPQLPQDCGIYLVGGEPTEVLLNIQKELNLKNVHFVDFRKKEALAEFYRAADVFVLPTRWDIWGLVINEALAYGLPVVSTEKCVAAQELVENGVNGYLVPIEDENALAEKLNAVLDADREAMGMSALEKIRPYTIENMALEHVRIFEEQ